MAAFVNVGAKRGREDEGNLTPPPAKRAKRALIEKLNLSRVFSDLPAPTTSRARALGRLWIHSNERKQWQTLARLSAEKTRGNLVIGVSGFFVLNVLAARETGAALLSGEPRTLMVIDISRTVEIFWRELGRIITTSPSKIEATEKIAAFLQKKARVLFPDWPCCTPKKLAAKQIKELHKESEQAQSWLFSQEQYERVKRVFDQGRFIFKRADLGNIVVIRQLFEGIHSSKLTLDTFYSSCLFGSICGVYRAKDIPEIHASVPETSLFISTIDRRERHYQRVTEGFPYKRRAARK